VKKYLYLSFVLIAILATSCKKPGSNPGPATDKTASTQLETQLEAGQGTWKMADPMDTLYDANNKVVYTLRASSSGYWVFNADQYSTT
jgi:hypothetical protein